MPEETNTLAYFTEEKFIAIENFIVQTPGHSLQKIKQFKRLLFNTNKKT
jgi:hypothetical protein